jgi:hypothetical protein
LTAILNVGSGTFGLGPFSFQGEVPRSKQKSFSEKPLETKRGEHFREPLTKRASFFRKPSSGRGSLIPKALDRKGKPFRKPPPGGNGRYRITSKPKQNKEGCLFRKPFYRGLSLPKAPVGSKGWHFGGSPLVRRACFLGSPLRKTGLAFPKALSEKKWALSLGSPPKKKGSLFSKARAHFW